LTSYSFATGFYPVGGPVNIQLNTWTGFEGVYSVVASFKQNIFIDPIFRFDSVYQDQQNIIYRTNYYQLTYNGTQIISHSNVSSSGSYNAYPWACSVELLNNEYCLTYNIGNITPNFVNPNFYTNILGFNEIFNSFGNLRPVVSGFKLSVEPT